MVGDDGDAEAGVETTDTATKPHKKRRRKHCALALSTSKRLSQRTDSLIPRKIFRREVMDAVYASTGRDLYLKHDAVDMLHDALASFSRQIASDAGKLMRHSDSADGDGASTEKKPRMTVRVKDINVAWEQWRRYNP